MNPLFIFFPPTAITTNCIYALELDYYLNRLINMKSWLKKTPIVYSKVKHFS